MKKILVLGAALALPFAVAVVRAQKAADVKDIVELERLTHTEVSDKIHKEGRTSVLVVTGGTE